MRQYDITSQAKVLGLVAGKIESDLKIELESLKMAKVRPQDADIPEFQVFIVFFAHILGGYKATIGSSLEDNRYYEVTYNKEKGEHYIDVYEKIENIAVADGPFQAPLN